MISSIDLREDTASREAAIRKLEFFIADSKVKKEGVVAVYHGSEGSGYEKKLKSAIRKAIKQYRDEGKISFYIYGENCSGDNASIRYLFSKNPPLLEENILKAPSSDFTLICIRT